MAFAATLETLSALGLLKHQGALNTQQFEILKSAARGHGVSEETLLNLNKLWGLRCDGTINGEEYSSELGGLFLSIRPLRSDASGSIPALVPGPQPLASPASPKVGRRQVVGDW